MKFRIMPLAVAAIIIIIFGAGKNTLHAQQKKGLLETSGHKGKVVTTMNSGGYTYIEFEEKGKRLWVACRPLAVSVDDIIEFSNAAPMKNFHSKTLKRTFETILFVNGVAVNGSIPVRRGLPKGHGPVVRESPANIIIEPGSVKKAENGYTVAECYAGEKSLAGKKVAVRGKVVKFTAGIMGKNWIHIRDGSGEEGTNDLTVTTTDTVAVGDLVLVTGEIAYDKDFGAGYKYKAIIQNASVTSE